jgi:hypothetical protein
VPAKVINGAAEITAVEQSNAGGDEVERCCAMRLPLVAEPLPMEPRQR